MNPEARPFSHPGLELAADGTGRSQAYYCLNDRSVTIDETLIRALKDRLDATGLGVIRVCLHPGPESTLHDMIIVQKREAVFRAHKHLAKEESYHMLEGRLRIDFFDDGGVTAGSVRIGAPGSGLPVLCRVRAGVWHSTAPETDYAVVHETRPGPFTGADSVPAPWDRS